MDGAPSLSVLFASQRLLPAIGGAELAALELLGRLARRHEVQACFLSGLPPIAGSFANPPSGVRLVPVEAPSTRAGYWEFHRRAREVLGRTVAASLERRRAHVVVTQLRAAPAVVEAAHAVGVPALLLLPSYESLCKYAFDAGSRCRPRSRCRECPAAAALDAAERRELIAVREAHERSLATAERLVAPSEAVARACQEWCGRRPHVVPPVAGCGPVVAAGPGGHLLLVASRWLENKGLELLVPLCRALDHRRVVVTGDGLTGRERGALGRLAHVSIVTNAAMSELLRGACMVLVPSQWPEPFGRVAFEGLAAGVPTLVAAVGGMPEFTPSGQLVSPPDSIEAWVAAVRRLEEPSAWRAAREAGIASARALLADLPLARLEAVVCQTAAASAPSVDGVPARDARDPGGAPAPAHRRAAAIRREIELARTVGLSCPKAGRSWICYFLARYVAARTGGPIDLDLLGGPVLPPLAFVHEHFDVYEDVAGPARLLNEELLLRRRVVVLVRDPRDSLVSYWYEKRFRERRPVSDRLEGFADSPVYGIERISQGTSLLLDLHDRHPGARLLVTYEGLVANPERRLRDILRFVLDGRPLDERACRIALAASRLEAMRTWERRLTPEEARTRYSSRFGPRHYGAFGDGEFKVRRGEVGGFATEMSADLRRRVTALPHTAALLERLASIGE